MNSFLSFKTILKLSLRGINNKNRPSLPSSVANDPDRRKEKAAVAAYTDKEKTYKEVTINRRITADNSEVKSYLRDLNTNEEGQLIYHMRPTNAIQVSKWGRILRSMSIH